MNAPLGREVGLTMDAMRPLRAGDYLVSAATGRTWLVTSSRFVQRGPNAGRRQRVRAVVVPHDHPEPGDRTIHFEWQRHR